MWTLIALFLFVLLTAGWGLLFIAAYLLLTWFTDEVIGRKR